MPLVEGVRYTNVNIYFHDEGNVAFISAEAHFMQNLGAKLLIGMDVLRHEGFRLDLDAETVEIASCKGLTVPIFTHAKLHRGTTSCVDTFCTIFEVLILCHILFK